MKETNWIEKHSTFLQDLPQKNSYVKWCEDFLWLNRSWNCDGRKDMFKHDQNLLLLLKIWTQNVFNNDVAMLYVIYSSVPVIDKTHS